MRYVAALFDAPIPARAALQALQARGFAAADVALLAEAELPGTAGLADGRLLPPSPPAGDWPGDDPPPPEAWRDEPRLEAALRRRGIEEEDAATFAEGVARRGAILVLVSAPTASAPLAAEALAQTLPPSPAAHRARWSSDPRARSGWSTLPPEEVAGP